MPAQVNADCATSVDFGADVTQSPTMLTGPLIAGWNPVRSEAAYLFAGQIDRATAGGAPNWTVLTVGAQINAVNRRGVNPGQGVHVGANPAAREKANSKVRAFLNERLRGVDDSKQH